MCLGKTILLDTSNNLKSPKFKSKSSISLDSINLLLNSQGIVLLELYFAFSYS